MTAVVVSLAVLAVVLVGVLGLVGWRDRNRLSAGEDRGALRDARADRARYDAERQFMQGEAGRGHTPYST
jgi:hypothetical protein